MSIVVLIVDDDTLLRAGLQMMIDTQPDLTVIGQADDGETAIAIASALKPDVVLMDIRMPGIDGLEATRRITGASPLGNDTKRPKVLILTTFEVDEYVYEALRAGARGFLLKDEVAAATAAGPKPTDVRHRELDRITDREREVLSLVASGFSNHEIADQLYIGESTVKTHVKHILTKLNLRDRIHAVVFAYQTGLIEPRNDA